MQNRPANETPDKLLFTPGPLTTSATVKQAMQHDLGSRDAAFIERATSSPATTTQSTPISTFPPFISA
jgi:aspartate aminotransferase-like enzyme